ncbi:hypothetical protein C8Q73DRAFT_180367 [Cubamyces lactineus]|nr:hypothetical protein C8Q73DRAFT_180367 [Cubamyces lactineus]
MMHEESDSSYAAMLTGPLMGESDLETRPSLSSSFPSLVPAEVLLEIQSIKAGIEKLSTLAAYLLQRLASLESSIHDSGSSSGTRDEHTPSSSQIHPGAWRPVPQANGSSHYTVTSRTMVPQSSNATNPADPSSTLGLLCVDISAPAEHPQGPCLQVLQARTRSTVRCMMAGYSPKMSMNKDEGTNSKVYYNMWGRKSGHTRCLPFC